MCIFLCVCALWAQHAGTHTYATHNIHIVCTRDASKRPTQGASYAPMCTVCTCVCFIHMHHIRLCTLDSNNCAHCAVGALTCMHMHTKYSVYPRTRTCTRTCTRTRTRTCPGCAGGRQSSGCAHFTGSCAAVGCVLVCFLHLFFLRVCYFVGLSLFCLRETFVAHLAARSRVLVCYSCVVFFWGSEA